MNSTLFDCIGDIYHYINLKIHIQKYTQINRLQINYVSHCAKNIYISLISQELRDILY